MLGIIATVERLVKVRVAQSRIPIPGRGPPSAVLAVSSPLALLAPGVLAALREIAAVAFVQSFTLHSALRTFHSLPSSLRAAIIVAYCAFWSMHSSPRDGCPHVSCSPFPVPRSRLLGVIHNGVCTSVHVKNRQIRVKIDQKGDVFRQKAIKKARVSSCPS